MKKLLDRLSSLEFDDKEDGVGVSEWKLLGLLTGLMSGEAFYVDFVMGAPPFPSSKFVNWTSVLCLQIR